MCYVALSVWLSHAIQGLAQINALLPLVAKSILLWLDHTLLSTLCWWTVAGFPFLAVMNDVAVSICPCIFGHLFSSSLNWLTVQETANGFPGCCPMLWFCAWGFVLALRILMVSTGQLCSLITYKSRAVTQETVGSGSWTVGCCVHSLSHMPTFSTRTVLAVRSTGPD